MRLLIFFLIFIPGSLSPCPDLVTSPKELVVALGSCLHISCRYDLCQVGQDPQLQKLQWFHQPRYDKNQQEFWGQKVGEPQRTSQSHQGGCDLVLPHIQRDHGGLYGLRLVARSTRGSHKGKEKKWMQFVTVNVTATPPAPHLWPDPTPIITEGSRTTFGCWVPPPCPGDTFKLTWEGPVTTSPGVSMATWTPPITVTSFPGLGITLSFQPSWDHDDTWVTCVLQGSDGTNITWSTQQLQVNYAPRDVRVEVTPSSPIYEGGEVTLRCQDKAKPPSYTYTWTLDGRVLPYSVDRIFLSSIQATHGGSYSCEATNVVGTTRSPLQTTLEVYYAPRDVRVEVTPMSPVHEGWEVTLRCHVTSNPPPSNYTWSLGGQVLPHHQGAQILLGATKATDGGSYSCQATNSLGTSRSPPTMLEVYYPPRAAILDILTPLPTLSGSPITLRCTLGPAHPVPSIIQWLLNERRHVTTVSPTLTFSAGPAHSGSFRCGGQNPAGVTLSPPLAVVVWYPPKLVRVLQTPGGPVMAGGGPVRLSCQNGGAEPPQIKVTWYKNGVQLPDPSPQLLLPHPHPSDAAVYVCEARNEAGGTRSPPKSLEVLFGPLGVELVPDPGPWVLEATNVTLRCQARAHPPPSTYEWFWEGRPLGGTPRGLWVLQGVTPGVAGRYRCRVTNPVATAESPEVAVSVRYATTPPLQRTLLGVGVGLSLLLVMGTLGVLLHRWWQQQKVAADEEPVVEPSGTFFLRHKKPRSPRCPPGPGVTSSLVAPPEVGSVPRMRGDTVVYAVLKRSHGGAKAPEGPDYENVHSGATTPSDGDREGTLIYAALALSPPRTARGQPGDLGDTVEYVALRH